jgi:hypothetical protein
MVLKQVIEQILCTYGLNEATTSWFEKMDLGSEFSCRSYANFKLSSCLLPQGSGVIIDSAPLMVHVV